MAHRSVSSEAKASPEDATRILVERVGPQKPGLPPDSQVDTESLANLPTLEVISGVANQKLFRLGSETVTIGRAVYNDLILQDKKVSRQHAAISFEKGHYFVEDLNSTNGVFLEGERITKAQIKTGSRITVGDSVLFFTQPAVDVTLADKLAFINKSDLFNWLDEETRMLLARHLVVRFFPKDAVVVHQNTELERMYFLYSGKARVVEINEEGGERLVAQLEAGEVFGERSLLAGESGTYSLVTSSDSYFLELAKDHLNELLQQKPEVSKAFYKILLRKLSTPPPPSDVAKVGKVKEDRLREFITPTEVQIVGEDRKIRDAKSRIEKLAKTSNTALIVGPTGTGKKTFARYFHKLSPYVDQPYLEISVAELGEPRVGPAIFGIEADPTATHMKGEIGYIEMIGNGTLAIAHAELLDAHQQSKLVTYLKHGWFHRVYGRESVEAKTNVLLLATGSEAEVMDKFIPELREILKEKTVSLPPLTQRLKDIPLIAEHYLGVYAKKSGKRIAGLSREATEKLVSYTWPGNIQELENVVQRAVIVSSESVIIPGDLIFVLPSEKEFHRINILRKEKVRDILRHPLIPKVFVWFNIFMIITVAGFTLFGGSRPPDHPLQEFGNNPGMLITWLVWFPILPISAFLLGRVWCGMCPIAGIGDLVARVRLNLPVPKILKKLDFWVVVFAFLFLDFFEEFWGVADKPWATGMLLVTIISLCALFCILFERRTFCRYVCPLAGMLGAYSTMSIVEVRGNKKVCQTQCGQHSCYKGTENAPGCPMFSYPASLTTNCECMMCLNCLKNCENRGVQINVRPPLQELWRQAQPQLSIALFGVMLVGLMARHEFPALTWWKTYEATLGWSEGFTHTVIFFCALACAVIPFTLSSSLSAAASQEKLSENMAQYGLAFIPLALSGHLAHVLRELLSEGIYDLIKYSIALYRSLFSGIPIGSQEIVISPFIHHSVITFIKFLLISGGFLGALIALVMIARRTSERRVMARIMPHLMVLIFFWIGYLFVFTGATGEPPAETTTSVPPALTTTTTVGGPVSTTPAAPPATATTAQPQVQVPVPSVSFSLLVPDIKNATTLPLKNPVVAKWLGSAATVTGTRRYKLNIQGTVTGAPAGALVRGGLELGTTTFQFSTPVDPKGRFAGDLYVDNLNQRMPLIFQVVDSTTNTVIQTHRVVFY